MYLSLDCLEAVEGICDQPSRFSVSRGNSFSLLFYHALAQLSDINITLCDDGLL